MKVYVFGNQDLPEDNLALKVVAALESKINGVKFVKVFPNGDLPFAGKKQVVIIDTVIGIDKVKLIEGDNLDKLIQSPRTSVHDFDLCFQLKYLQKLGKLKKVTIIGLTMKGKIDYFLIQAILRKLVAQDIQGS